MEPFCKEHWGWKKSLPYPEMGEGKKGLGAGPSTLQAPGPAGERAPALLQAGFPQDTWHRSEGGCLGLLELLETHFWHPHNSSRLQEALAQQTRAETCRRKHAQQKQGEGHKEEG